MGTRYLGGYITATEQTPSTSSSTGVWQIQDALTNTQGETWQIVIIPRGLFFGGSDSNVIDFITITSTGNATDFGDVLGPTTAVTNGRMCGSGSSVRGLMNSGDSDTTADGNFQDNLQFVTIASAGNGSNFGDLTQARLLTAAAGNSTRCCFLGGYTSSGVNTIDFATISTLGNASDFGDLTNTNNYLNAGAGSGSSRGMRFGGSSSTASSSVTNTVDYITISPAGS
jgi:hypothetical protein